MKKHIYLIATALILFQSAFAQEESKPKHRNIIKLNLFSLLAGNIMLQDEFTLSSRTSVALGIGILPNYAIGDRVDFGDGSSTGTKMSVGGLSITPEFRLYTGNRGPKGFYLAPYYRYAKYTSDVFDYSFDKASGGTESVKMEGTYKNNTLGLMIGSQWLLSKHLTLDWWIVGVGVGSVSYEAKGTGNFSQADQDDFNNSVADIDAPLFDFESSINSNSASFKATVPIGFRGFGLCLGYMF